MVQETPSKRSPVDPDLLNRAQVALIKYHERTAEQEDKASLLGSDLPVYVQFTLVRVPEKTSTRPICLDIPHPLHKLMKDDNDGHDDAQDDIDNDGLDDVEVCLIVKDEAKPWVVDLIQKFPSHLSYIKKVLTLTSLRKKYTQYKDRRELVGRYDLFLADDRILPMLGKALGKSFFQQKKQPVPIKVTRKEALPFAVKRCLSGTFMWVSAGTCLSIKAGNTAMPTRNLTENIDAIIVNAASHIPRKWGNIAAISIKTNKSVALPIYNKTPEDLEAYQSKKEETGDEKKRERELSVQSDGDTEKERDVKKQKLELAKKSPLLKALGSLKGSDKNESKEMREKELRKASTLKRDDKDKNFNKNTITETTQKSPLLKTLKSMKTRDEQLISGENTEKSEIKKRKKKITKLPEGELMKKNSEGKKKSKEKEHKCVLPVKKQKVTDSGAERPKTSDLLRKKDADSDITEKKQFIVSRKFTGSKAGYVFYKGPKGIGYYIDVKPVPPFGMIARSNRGDQSRRSPTPKSKRRKSGGQHKRR